jgi:hypothetical protein
VTFLISHKGVLSIKRAVVDGKGASPPPQQPPLPLTTVLTLSTTLSFVIPTRISCHTASDTAACAPFSQGKAHEVRQRHQFQQEIRGSEADLSRRAVEGSAVPRTYFRGSAARDFRANFHRALFVPGVQRAMVCGSGSHYKEVVTAGSDRGPSLRIVQGLFCIRGEHVSIAGDKVGPQSF